MALHELHDGQDVQRIRATVTRIHDFNVDLSDITGCRHGFVGHEVSRALKEAGCTVPSIITANVHKVEKGVIKKVKDVVVVKKHDYMRLPLALLPYQSEGAVPASVVGVVVSVKEWDGADSEHSLRIRLSNDSIGRPGIQFYVDAAAYTRPLLIGDIVEVSGGTGL